jgi:hypothetical protein
MREGLAQRVGAGVGCRRVARIDPGDAARHDDALGVAQHDTGVGEDLLRGRRLAEPQCAVAEVLDRQDRAALFGRRRPRQRAEPHADRTEALP